MCAEDTENVAASAVLSRYDNESGDETSLFIAILEINCPASNEAQWVCAVDTDSPLMYRRTIYRTKENTVRAAAKIFDSEFHHHKMIGYRFTNPVGD